MTDMWKIFRFKKKKKDVFNMTTFVMFKIKLSLMAWPFIFGMYSFQLIFSNAGVI